MTATTILLQGVCITEQTVTSNNNPVKLSELHTMHTSVEECLFNSDKTNRKKTKSKFVFVLFSLSLIF